MFFVALTLIGVCDFQSGVFEKTKTVMTTLWTQAIPLRMAVTVTALYDVRCGCGVFASYHAVKTQSTDNQSVLSE